MKYKVSLLPVKNKKRIIGKKKAEKAKSVSLVILLLLLANVFILLICNTVAENKKAEIVALNHEYEQKVAALQQYRDINTNLQNKIALIKSIQVNEPSLANFLAILGNIDHPGVSVTTIDCSAWNAGRVCTITGTATSRAVFNNYLETLQGEKSFSGVSCSSYVANLENGKLVANFTINITCAGGAAPVVAATAPAAQ